MGKKYKFGHLFYATETKSIFITRFINMLYDSDNGFNTDEHIIFTPYESVYNKFRSYNIKLIKSSELFSGNIANRCMKEVDVLFCHGLCSTIHTLLIKKNTLKNMVWRTWGSEITNKPSGISPLKKILYPISLKRLNNIFMFGVANITDEIAIKQYIDNPHFCTVPYLRNYNCQISRDVRPIEERMKKANILLGHSGYQGGNHIAILKKLEPYKGKIKIYAPLSYYNSYGVDEIVSFGKGLYGEDFIAIEKFVPYHEYVEFLSNMDVAIFDGKTSYALGNISILLALGKKIYLNNHGTLSEAFIQENLPFGDTSLIGEDSFESFIECEDYSKFLINSSFRIKENEEYIKSFKELLKEIKKIKNI